MPINWIATSDSTAWQDHYIVAGIVGEERGSGDGQLGRGSSARSTFSSSMIEVAVM